MRAFIKLSQGEFFSPEAVEQVIQQSPFVLDVFVHGDSIQSYPVAIVVPRMKTLKEWAKLNGIGGEDEEESLEMLCKNTKVQEHILTEIKAMQWNAKGYERVKRVYLHPIPFEQGNNFVSPSLKLRRDVLKKFFRPQIDQLYTLV